jgi:hypothetical protein
MVLRCLFLQSLTSFKRWPKAWLKSVWAWQKRNWSSNQAWPLVSVYSPTFNQSLFNVEMQVECQKKTAEKWFFVACVSDRLVDKLQKSKTTKLISCCKLKKIVIFFVSAYLLFVFDCFEYSFVLKSKNCLALTAQWRQGCGLAFSRWCHRCHAATFQARITSNNLMHQNRPYLKQWSLKGAMCDFFSWESCSDTNWLSPEVLYENIWNYWHFKNLGGAHFNVWQHSIPTVCSWMVEITHMHFDISKISFV